MDDRRSSSRRRFAILAAASLLATVACGSTAQTNGQSVLTDGSSSGADGTYPVEGDGLGPVGGDPGEEAAPGPGEAGVAGPSLDGVDGGSGLGSESRGADPTSQRPGSDERNPADGTAPGADGARGPGVTDTSIYLGVPYCSDCASGNAAAGTGGEDPGDTRRYLHAVLDEVNGRGGVLGRRLVPVWHEISVSDNIDASAQAACETWTKDNKVLAMFMRGEIAYECAKKAGIIVVGTGGTKPVFDRYPNLFTPASARLEQVAASTVKAMVRAGWHKPEPKWPTGRIGLITWDAPDYRYAMKHGWLPALHGAGLKETDVRYITVPQNASSVADASASISSAVLTFREKGIDHVFIGDGPAGIFVGAGLTNTFLYNAKSQQYYPRYGFNSDNVPGWENHPADQQVGMLAIDAIDNERSNDEGIALNPQRERCWEIMKQRGLPVGDTQTGNIAIGACETAWFTEAVLKRARGTTLPHVVAAAESLGTSYRSPWTYGTRITPNQHDGVFLYRNARFDESCSCMKYASKPYEP